VIGKLSKVLYDRVNKIKSDLDRKARGEVVLTHVPTGLSAFDDKFGGLEIGVLTLVLGHTGDGKTSLLGHLAKHAALAGVGVLLILLEDPAGKLADRYLASTLGVSANDLARLKFDDQRRLDAAADLDSKWAQYVGLISGQYSSTEVKNHIRQTTHIGGAPVGLVVVDYAQSFGAEDRGMEAVCADMAWTLNALAEERELAVVLGSQVSSECLARGRTRFERTLASGKPDVRGFIPGPGDVMWARRMEQYAKAAMYVFREGHWRRKMGDAGARDNTIEVGYFKANFGPTGAAVFDWDGQSCTITDRALS
jgi:replicative DNA helicase